MEFIDDSFPAQTIEKKMMSDAHVEVTQISKEELVGVSLGCSDCEMEFRCLRGERKPTSRLPALAFWRVYFGLFRDLFGRIPGKRALERRVFYKSWLIFRDRPLQVQPKEQDIKHTWEETCMNEQASDTIQSLKVYIQEVPSRHSWETTFWFLQF